MHFARPDYLYLLLLLIPIAGLWVWFLRWKQAVKKRAGDAHLIEAMAAAASPGRVLAQSICVFLATLLLILAVAQPQWGRTEREVSRMGLDIVFALDLSRSMLARDAVPDRLQAARDELRLIMSRLSGDRVGLVIFTSISFAQSPLTTDYGAINFFLERLHPDQIPVGGTSIGAAMRDSIEVLIGRSLSASSPGDTESPMQRAKNQVIVLITDGEDHESDPGAAANLAREHGIRVVTVGIGSPSGAQVPTFDERGNFSGYLRSRNGEYVITKLDETTLKQVAHQTSGTYIHYNQPGSVANGLVSFLNELEKSELEVLMRERYKDRFHFFLIPAFLLLLLASLLGSRRQSWQLRRLWTRAKTTLLAIGAVLAIFAGTGCEGTFEAPLRGIEEAKGLIAAGLYDEALERLRGLEQSAGHLPAYHYNLGLAHLWQGNFEQAREAFGRAMATRDESLRFDVLYNLALALAGGEKWQEAFDVNKEALALALSRPDLVDEREVERVRHNLEVILRRLYPPCSELEDELEPNDTPAQATPMETSKQEDVTLCGLNDDWFALAVHQGTLLTVSANFKTLRENPDPEHVFLPRSQDLQIAIFDGTAQQILAVEQGLTEDADTLQRMNRRRRVERKIERFELTPNIFPNPEGIVFIKVMAAEGLEFTYDLEVEAIPPCRILDDEHEPNDTASAAANLDPGAHQLHICPGNEDWFRVSVPEEGSFFVDLQPMEDPARKMPPELTLEIRDDQGRRLLARGASDGTFLTAGLQNVDRPGDYLVRIVGADDDAQGPYALTLFTYEACPAGDDYYAPNYHPQLAHTLDAQMPVHRYLRICEDTPDFFMVTPDEENKIEWGLQHVDPLASRVNDDGAYRRTPLADLPQLTLNHIDVREEVLNEGLLVEEVTGDMPLQVPPFAPMHRMLVAEELPEEEPVMIRVEGSPGFYHLIALNPQDAPQEEQEEEEDQSQDEEDQSDDEQEQDEADEDEGEQDESEGDEDSEGEEEEQDHSDGEEGDEDGAEDAPSPSHEEESAELTEIEDILRALEQSDENFQLKKSLENLPRRNIDRDW